MQQTERLTFFILFFANKYQTSLFVEQEQRCQTWMPDTLRKNGANQGLDLFDVLSTGSGSGS